MTASGKGAGRAFLAGLAGAALATLLGAGGLGERADLWGVDLLQRQQGGSIDERLLLVDVDGSTLDALGWPVKREYFALVAQAARRAGAAGVGFDVLFLDPGPSPEADRALASSLEAAGAVVAAELHVPRDATEPGLPRAASSRTPAGSVVGAARLGHVQVDVRPDGVIRRIPALVRVGEALMPALGLAAAGMLEPGGAAPAMESGQLRLGERKLPLDERGQLGLRFRSIPASSRLSLLELVQRLRDEPERLAATLRGKLLLVGYSAHSVGDRAPNPLGSDRPQVDSHAHLADTVLRGDALDRLPRAWELGLAILLGAVVAAAAVRLRTGLGLVALAVAVLCVAGAFVAGFYRLNLQLGFTTALASIGFAYLGAQTTKLWLQERQERLLRGAFERFVSPRVLERILQSPEMLQVAGKEAELAILFSDIRGYTELSNRIGAAGVLELLRGYLDAMTRLILEHEGTVDKIMGDGILAFFGDPVPSQNPSEQAVRCALAMQARVREQERLWAAQGMEGLKIRVGIATGPVYVGNIGSEQHLEYTVIGPTVNLASRLEGHAPAGGVLVSKETFEKTRESFTYQALPGLALKGFAEAYDAWLCVGPSDGGEVAEPDRRRFRRLTTSLPVRLRQGERALEALVDDVGPGGMFIRCQETFEEGERLELEFSDGSFQGSGGLRVSAVVRHRNTEPGRSGVGVAIDRVESTGPEAFRRFLSLFFQQENALNSGLLQGDGGVRYRYELNESFGRLERQKD